MHAALKLQCGRVTGNKKFTIGGLIYDIIRGLFYQLFVGETGSQSAISYITVQWPGTE